MYKTTQCISFLSRKKHRFFGGFEEAKYEIRKIKIQYKNFIPECFKHFVLRQSKWLQDKVLYRTLFLIHFLLFWLVSGRLKITCLWCHAFVSFINQVFENGHRPETSQKRILYITWSYKNFIMISVLSAPCIWKMVHCEPTII